MRLHYFAFGSNLSSRRLLQRLPGAEFHCVATLAGHRLWWRGNARGQSGKCDLAVSDDTEHLVHGVVYRVTPEDRATLDEIECRGYGYERRDIRVAAPGGDRLEAFAYYAIGAGRPQPPFHWYKEHVLRGALEHGLPGAYVEAIRATPSIDDPDADRQRRELAIYEDHR